MALDPPLTTPAKGLAVRPPATIATESDFLEPELARAPPPRPAAVTRRVDRAAIPPTVVQPLGETPRGV